MVKCKAQDSAFDVVIAGGGPAGAVISIALATSGMKVLVVNRRRRHSPFGDILPPEAGPIVAKLGLTKILDATNGPALPCPGIRSSFSSQSVAIMRIYRNADGSGSGWVIDRIRFEELLEHRARLSGASWLTDATVTKAECENGGGWRISLLDGNGGSEVTARILVDATGRHAAVARRLGAQLRRLSVRVAVTGQWETSAPVAPGDSHLIVERDGTAWWYSVRVPNGDLHAAVHFLPRRQELRGDFAHILENGPPASGWTAARMARLVDTTSLKSFRVLDAGMSRIEPMVGNNWLAIGDAAAAFDPLSGQGLTNAMVSGVIAARAVEDYLNGHRQAFAVYEDAMWVTHERSAHLIAQLYEFNIDGA